MRLPLTSRRDACQRVDPSRRGGIGAKPGPQRDQAVAASETVALVLDKDLRLPESAADVEDLTRRLCGHIGQLGALVEPGAYAQGHPQQLRSASVPDDRMPSRVNLVALAEATQELVTTVQTRGINSTKLTQERRWWRPQVNVLRGAVFAVAFACVVLAASTSRT